ncbi:hypothetical protein [Glycomyces rhizosphaerae]|uniref:NB-ARC domain-containing protein n=1 Tax=Glycomyces rhizosphaerae TaxID=2054422 RepID=A0ABV7Q0X2_9ACTN
MPENTAPQPGFTVNDPRVHNLIQGQQVQLHMNQPVQVRVHSFAEGPLLIGRIPRPAAARTARAADRGIAADSRTVITGMVGSGKTQLAAGNARTRWDAGEIDLLLWVNASTRDGIATAFAEAGTAVRGSANPDQFLSWLDRPNTPRWLIVLDGVSDPDHLTDLWPPENSRGQTILTTRIRSAALDGHRIHIGPFTPEESAAYLERRLGSGSSALKGAKALAAELGHLPLALAHVAAHLLDRPGLDCTAYSQLFIRKPDGSAPANRLPALDAMREAIEHADRREPERFAKPILCLASDLDPAGVPATLFRSAATRNAFKGINGIPADSPVLVRAVQEALASLHRLSLIDLDGEVVRIHPLVQRAGAEFPGAKGRTAWTNVAIAALREIKPGSGADPATLAVFQANAKRVQAIAKTAPPPPAQAVHPDDLTDLMELSDLGISQINAGDTTAGLANLEAALTGYTRVLGPDDEITANTRKLIADARKIIELIRLKDSSSRAATALLEEALEDCLRRVGPYDLQTFNARSNLAHHQGDILGDYGGAVAAMELIVADAIRVFGPSALMTDALRADLAEFRRKATTPGGPGS